jgi:hypothetical protein
MAVLVGKVLSWVLVPVGAVVARLVHGWDWEADEDEGGS